VPISDVPSRNRRSPQKAYTLVELLAGIFVFSLPLCVAQVVRAKYGTGMAILAGLLTFPVGILIVIAFYRWSSRRNKRRLTELRQKYRGIYRVKVLPTDAKSIVKPPEAEIRIGDYGWEARPNRRNGLVHLQGLTKTWKVVWHAGFAPDQIEKVAEKPASQYDYWIPYWAKTPPPPPCPFPVLERSTPTMGLPHYSGHYFENHPSQHYSPEKA
jgi:hypothetical protein